MSIKKLSKIRRNDPHFEREKKTYEYPLPSREYILQILEEQGKPVSGEQLCVLLDIRDDEFDMFQRRLGAMEREAQLMRNRKGAYIVPERASLIAGRIEGHADGYGFLVPDDGGDDLFLDAKQMSKVLHRDRALARVVGLDRKGRREGAIVECDALEDGCEVAAALKPSHELLLLDIVMRQSDGVEVRVPRAAGLACA